MTLARVRAEIEPCADHEYAAFRLRWITSAAAELRAEQGGVAAVLDQLSGSRCAPEIWERAILPARIPGYRPEMLDLVCMSGQLKWVADARGEDAECASGEDAVANYVHRRERRVCLSTARPSSTNRRCEGAAVLARSGAAGAQYLDEVAERAKFRSATRLRVVATGGGAAASRNDNFAPLRMFTDDRIAERALESGRAATRRLVAMRPCARG